MAPTDENLMLAVREGRLDELGTLFERHHQALFQFFFRVTGSRSASEDLVQDVFFRMLKYRQNYGARGRFRAWMFHIARNARVDYFKKRPPVGSETGVEAEPPSPAPFPSEQVERAEEVALLKQALHTLPPEKRELLVLARFRELRHDEIAEILGVTSGTVRVRLHRAVKDLEQAFRDLSGRTTSCNVSNSKTRLRTT